MNIYIDGDLSIAMTHLSVAKAMAKAFADRCSKSRSIKICTMQYRFENPLTDMIVVYGLGLLAIRLYAKALPSKPSKPLEPEYAIHSFIIVVGDEDYGYWCLKLMFSDNDVKSVVTKENTLTSCIEKYRAAAAAEIYQFRYTAASDVATPDIITLMAKNYGSPVDAEDYLYLWPDNMHCEIPLFPPAGWDLELPTARCAIDYENLSLTELTGMTTCSSSVNFLPSELLEFHTGEIFPVISDSLLSSRVYMATADQFFDLAQYIEHRDVVLATDIGYARLSFGNEVVKRKDKPEFETFFSSVVSAVFAATTFSIDPDDDNFFGYYFPVGVGIMVIEDISTPAGPPLVLNSSCVSDGLDYYRDQLNPDIVTPKTPFISDIGSDTYDRLYNKLHSSDTRGLYVYSAPNIFIALADYGSFRCPLTIYSNTDIGIPMYTSYLPTSTNSHSDSQYTNIEASTISLALKYKNVEYFLYFKNFLEGLFVRTETDPTFIKTDVSQVSIGACKINNTQYDNVIRSLDEFFTFVRQKNIEDSVLTEDDPQAVFGSPMAYIHDGGDTSGYLQLEIETFNYINAYRVANGVAKLRFDYCLSTAGRIHINDLNDADAFSHYGSDGNAVGIHIAATGFSGGADVTFLGGENIAGANSPFAAFEAWRTSTAGHNEAMLNPKFTACGIAVVGSLTQSWDYYITIFAGDADL